MDPLEKQALWHEMQRLQRQLENAEVRHAETLKEIRKGMAVLELKLGEEVEGESVEDEEVVVPPPLPERVLREEEVGGAMEVAKVAGDEVTVSGEEVVAVGKVEETDGAGKDGSFELNFGRVWFVRIGIVILLTGLVFLGNYAYQNWVREMPNWVRLVALFGCAGGLIEVGRRLAVREQLRAFGEVVMAGGMAFAYYCTFAAHHVERLRVVSSPVLAAVLLFLAAGAIAVVSWRRQAKVTAALGFVLAAYATMLQPIGWMSCVSSVLLGAMGLFFMLKPGWAGPGWASMLGSYGAFFGWQSLGAAGGGAQLSDPASLWFLPPLWVMFCVPGVVGEFRESLSERARAWFTGVNNACFFLLFSEIWVQLNGSDGYWKVAAVFGVVLIGLGVVGRRQDATAGGVNIAQGLAVATFALVLKLEGQNLVLVLAFESLLLAIAALKFRGKSESVFSLLCGVGSAGMLLLYEMVSGKFGVSQEVAVWSMGLTAAVIVAASCVLVRVRHEWVFFSRFIRFSSLVLFLCAAVVTSYLCAQKLDEWEAMLTGVLVAGLLSAGAVWLDRERRQPELKWGGLWFLFIAMIAGVSVTFSWVYVVAVLIALGGCWLWHREEEEGRNLLSWGFSAAVPVFLWQLGSELYPVLREWALFNGAAALALVPVAVLLTARRLGVVAGAFALGSFLLCLPQPEVWKMFVVAALGAGGGVVLHLAWARKKVEEIYRGISSLLFRVTGLAAYCGGWFMQTAETWFDWLALSAVVAVAASVFLKRRPILEVVGLVVVAVVALFVVSLESPWELSAMERSWRGVLVVGALLALLLTYQQRPALIQNVENRRITVGLLTGVTSLIVALWSTQMLVWRLDWKPVAVLWTVLGFAYVSVGLWQRLHIQRIAGFVLLMMALAKLFLVDVWDFTAFMRVVSFIVLGAALILLGLFYNKFAHVMKALLDE